MSTLSRLMHIPAGRRAYSYFSSRSGGGRYFNSAKPPKAPVVAGKAGNPTSSKADSPAESNQPNTAESTASPPPSSSSSSSSSVQHTSSKTTNSVASDSDATPNNQNPSFNTDLDSRQLHVPTQIISPKDFKMHQFFSLHRPLLLIPHPSSLFRDLPSNLPLFNPLPPSEAEIHKAVIKALGDLSFSSSDPFLVDADAEAARQLTRALTMSKASATASWEETLKTLGLDLSEDTERVHLQEQFDKDWKDVMLDSTKRKRRKKMKKHKLKKRRRATRAERLRLK